MSMKGLMRKCFQGKRGNLLEKACAGSDKSSAMIAHHPQDNKLAKWVFDNLKEDNREVWVDWNNSPPVSSRLCPDFHMVVDCEG